jgi:hypothetical protein
MQLNVKPGYETLAEAFEQCVAVEFGGFSGVDPVHELCGPRYLAGLAIGALGSKQGLRVEGAVNALANLVWLLDATARNAASPRYAASMFASEREGWINAAYQKALDQAQSGKGVQQHGKNFNDGSEAPKPFTEQAIFTITKMVGEGFCIGQTIKKISEAMVKFDRGEKDACVRELLGAMVYAASTLIKTGE